MNEQKFWLDEPKMMGGRGVSLLIPAIASAIGFFAFAVLGFGFTELSVLPQWFRTGLVLVGAFALAFGGEIGTLSNTVEIFRKNGQANAWDWTALIVSALATLAAFLLAFSALFGARATWASWLQIYGPVVLGLLAALDSYGGFVEFGLYLNSFDKRYREWQDAKREFEQNPPDVDPVIERLISQVEQMQRELDESKYPVATLADWRDKVVSSLNGNRAGLLQVGKSAQEVVSEACKLAGFRAPVGLSNQTYNNWKKLLEA